MGASFFAEASGESCIFVGKRLGFNPLLHVEGRNRLLRGRNQIQGFFVVGAFDLVQVLREVRELTSLLHDCLFHEERRLHWSVTLRCKFGEAVVDQGLVEKDSEPLEVVASVTCNTLTTVHLKDAKALHDLVMVKLSKLFACNHKVPVWSAPGSFNLVKVLVVVNFNFIADNVSNLVEEICSLCDRVFRNRLLLLDLVVNSLGPGLFCRDVSFFIGFLLVCHGLAHKIFLFTQVVKCILG